jgi:hypothetical protein
MVCVVSIFYCAVHDDVVLGDRRYPPNSCSEGLRVQWLCDAERTADRWVLSHPEEDLERFFNRCGGGFHVAYVHQVLEEAEILITPPDK